MTADLLVHSQQANSQSYYLSLSLQLHEKPALGYLLQRAMKTATTLSPERQIMCSSRPASLNFKKAPVRDTQPATALERKSQGALKSCAQELDSYPGSTEVAKGWSL